MSDVNMISTAELQTVLASLKSQKEIIEDTWKNIVFPVLESSSSCFSVAGLNYENIQSELGHIFSQTCLRLDSLIFVLENDVIKNYSEVAYSIRQIFNADFAAQMADLLPLSASDESVSFAD